MDPAVGGRASGCALDGVGKFVMLWRKTGDEWRVSRVISYGFRAPN